MYVGNPSTQIVSNLECRTRVCLVARGPLLEGWRPLFKGLGYGGILCVICELLVCVWCSQRVNVSMTLFSLHLLYACVHI